MLHTLTGPGTYQVLVWMPMKQDTSIALSYGTITVSGTPAADFGSDVRTGQAPLAVAFTDRSTGTGPLAYAWDFETDGTVDSSLRDPDFTFTGPGM